MNEIEKLIKELCPNGVEFKRLGEVCEIKGRIGFRGYTRRDLVNESEGAISLSPSNIVNGKLMIVIERLKAFFERFWEISGGIISPEMQTERM